MARQHLPGSLSISHRQLTFAVTCRECGDTHVTGPYHDNDKNGARIAATHQIRMDGWKYSLGRGWFCRGCEWARKGTG